MSLIVVYCGTGIHSENKDESYKTICKLACRKADETLRHKGSALDACEGAITFLENSGLTNAGYGSNLNVFNDVECEAAIMDGKNGNFGACATLNRVANPISLAKKICQNQYISLHNKPIIPQLLVGLGAEFYATQCHIELLNSNKLLVTEKQINAFINTKPLFINDTVGAICLNKSDCIVGGISSGGLFSKLPGSIGYSAIYGAGVWAEHRGDDCVAVCTTGCDDDLIRTQLARNLANSLFESNDISHLQQSLQQKFFQSGLISNMEKKVVGVLIVQKTASFTKLIWGHNTPKMAIGWSYLDDNQNNGYTMSKVNALITRIDNSTVNDLFLNELIF